MADEKEVGWEIFGQFYRHNGVSALKHGHYRLVRLVTGLTTDEWLNSDDLQGGETGWIAVAFAQGHPEMNMEQVARIIDDLKVEDVKQVGFDFTDEVEQSPPEEGEIPSTSKSPTSEPTAEEPPATSNPANTGAPVSRIGAA